MNNNIFSPSHTRRSKGEKVCGIDLDDVLADSIPNWITFANMEMKEIDEKCNIGCISPEPWVRPYQDLYDLKRNVPYYYYRMFKDKYRRSDTKANLPHKHYAYDLLFWLKSEMGYKIVIITKRDEDICSKLTYKWLDKNGIPFDEVIFHHSKHIKIMERFPEMDFMIEDNRDIANIIGNWGYTVYLIHNKYNSGKLNPRVRRVNGLRDVYEILREGK